jgi:F-type H+-transporting ATPase subunit b
MEQILHDLGTLLLKSVPTIILLLFVYAYLTWMFFKPLQRILEQRREATGGAREAAQKSLDRAAEKATMYEIALKEARADMYREQEQTRRQLLEQQTTRIDEARKRAHAQVLEASKEIDAETAKAKAELASSSQMLALQIVEELVTGRGARGRIG